MNTFLIQSLKNTLINSHFTNLTVEVIDLCIDSFSNMDFLKDIPIANIILSTFKFAQNVHDKNLLKQTLVFINEFNNSGITSDKVKKHIERLENKPKLLNEELGRVLILLNGFIDSEKSVFLAKLYVSYINQQIDFAKFCELSDMINRLFMSDIEVLKTVYDNKGVTDKMFLSYRHSRLISLGILINQASLSGGVFMYSLNSKEPQIIIKLTDIGKQFCEVVFNSNDIKKCTL